MRMRKLLSTVVLALGVSAFAVAQQDAASAPSGRQTDSGVKSDMQEAGHDTADAAKKTGHKVKKGTKKATHKAAKKTKEESQKVEDKTTPPQQ